MISFGALPPSVGKQTLKFYSQMYLVLEGNRICRTGNQWHVDSAISIWVFTQKKKKNNNSIYTLLYSFLRCFFSIIYCYKSFNSFHRWLVSILSTGKISREYGSGTRGTDKSGVQVSSLKLMFVVENGPPGHFGACLWGCWWSDEDISFHLSDYLTPFLGTHSVRQQGGGTCLVSSSVWLTEGSCEHDRDRPRSSALAP